MKHLIDHIDKQVLSDLFPHKQRKIDLTDDLQLQRDDNTPQQLISLITQLRGLVKETQRLQDEINA